MNAFTSCELLRARTSTARLISSCAFRRAASWTPAAAQPGWVATLEAFEAAVRDKPEVMECYVMTGDEDYLLRVAVTDLVALERFLLDELSRIPGISRIKTSLALKQVKYETALPLAASLASRRVPIVG